MELAAVVMLPGQKNEVLHEPRVLSSATSPAIGSLLAPVLGNDLLGTWTERVHKLGVSRLWLTSDAHAASEAWSALGGLIRKGIERLLLIKLKSYAEMDLSDLIRFHCQNQNAVTEVHDSRGQLGVCVLDRQSLSAANGKNKKTGFALDPDRTCYPFYGYAKRILSARERQELVGDALTGGCAMRPLGKEVSNQVWVGGGVQLDDSARIIGPAYIGDGTIVRAGATIGPFASIEHDCIVGCGTTVERSTILPGTYLAPGILIRHALVDGGSLEDLRCGAVADLSSGRLAGKIYSSRQSDRAMSKPHFDVFTEMNRDVPDLASCSEQWREMRL